ncbi:hypothetical protein PCPL58_p3093 (plasmid) [Pseudomonas cerasi]|nr:hypothetical protein PCPL58_p3093 [Pseudomonas cerasi]
MGKAKSTTHQPGQSTKNGSRSTPAILIGKHPYQGRTFLASYGQTVRACLACAPRHSA